MAESIREKVIGNNLSRVVNENSPNVECAVCLQTCIHPAELPCGHIFCYLCIKGIVNQGRRCAMCRQDIPVDYLDKPRLLKPVDAENGSQGFEDGLLWFYEGHNGWWQYDERTSLELELAYQKGERCCELLIAGFLYIADFDAMLQYRRNDPNRRRRIKRDLATTTKKGVAGLKASKDCSSTVSNVPDLVSNELIQSLPITGQSMLSNLNGMRLLSLSDSNPSNSTQENPEQGQPEPRLRSRNLSNMPTQSICNEIPQTSTNSTSQTDEDDTFYSRNFDLDTIIQDTLDWTIEQIESLNLELLNDYEVLFRDVNNYGQLHDNLDRNRLDATDNGYQNQLLTLGIRVNRSFENELDSTDETTSLPSLNHSEDNASTVGPSQSIESNTISSRVIEPLSETSQLPNHALTTPQPSPRTRGMSRIGSRVMPPTQSTSLSHETLF